MNTANNTAATRKLMEKTLGVDSAAILPKYHSDTARKRLAKHQTAVSEPEVVNRTRGKVALFTTCYGNYNEPHIAEDLVKVFEHNQIAMRLVGKEQCCGMPKLELGDLESVAKAKDAIFRCWSN